MISSYKKFWNNIFNFSSTSSRSDYWWPVIINYILSGLIISIIQKMMGHPIEDIYNLTDLTANWALYIINIIVWIGTFTVKVRRLHDTDRSGWWLLIDLIPVIGTIWFFILMILPSKRSRWN
ncbi:DUF805 domain-containing protein [Companilactobacillus nantensis]|uniref:DUF805 domain-containing protein n=1 Tax=Companilactobacillus nantensis TaxID=305793 RepID=UPI00070B4627|nr:DUF805 domain-containing protein [Companilactobacillus nantensis]GEO64827.1 membrane protein [Companilactobacillus nantensis]